MPKAAKKPKWTESRTHTMTAHNNGQWCKKIKGKVRFFGVWGDPAGALSRYLKHVDALERGENAPTTPSRAGVTIADVFNLYLESRKGDIDTGRREARADNNEAIGPAMFRRYIRAAEIVAAVIGADREAQTLKPVDFTKIKSEMKGEKYKYGASTMSGYIRAIRTVFEWAAEDAQIIPHRLSFGSKFVGEMAARTIRRKRIDGEKKLVDADTLRKLIAVANPHVRAMIRLGINVAFYAIDCSDLRITDIDFTAGTLKMERHKTQMQRLAALWPETIADLKTAIATRPTPKDSAHADRVFITKRGHLWVKTQDALYDDAGKMKSVTHNDYIAQEFVKLFEKAGIERPKSCTFAWLRHTFYTIARKTKCDIAVNAVMGHSGGGMTEHYLEDVDIAELRTVSNYVRAWLVDEGAAVVGKIG